MGHKISLAGAVVAAVLTAAASSVSAQGKSGGPISVWNPIIAASVERLSAESRSWRDALDAVAATGRRAVITTSDTVKGADLTALAQVEPIVDDDSRVDTVVVIVNLDLLRKLSRLPVDATDFEDDLDRILAHEVYGHAIPFLLAGSMSGKCADPVVGQSAIAACAIQRENIIRREMQLGQRVEYGRESLAIARRNWNY